MKFRADVRSLPVLGHGPQGDAVDAKEERVEGAGRQQRVVHALEEAGQLQRK